MRRCLILYGLTCIIGQVLALREICVLFHGNELVYGAALAAWLLLFAIGSGLIGRIAERKRLSVSAFVLALAAAGLMVPITLLLARSARWLIIGRTGITPPLGSVLLTTLLVLAPLCLLLGFFYALACAIEMRRHEDPARTAARIYVFEALGTFVGGVLFTYVLIQFLDAVHIALAVALLDSIAAFAVWRHDRRRRPWGWALLPLAALLAIAILSPAGAVMDALSQSLRFPGRRLLLSRDTPYGRIDVTEARGQKEFYQSGALAAATHTERKAEETAFIALLAHPSPRRALIIGGHLNGILRKALAVPGLRVDYVELDPELIRMARRFAPPADRAVLNSPRVTVITRTDGRRFIKRSKTRYDVILSAVPNPSTGLINRFYTAEFFAEARAALAENGILFLSIEGSPAYMSAPHRALAASVFHTLKARFGTVAAFPADHAIYYLATPRRSAAFPSTRAWPRRMVQWHIATQWLTPAALREITDPARAQRLRDVLRSTRLPTLNADLHPLAYYHALLLWAQAFRTSAAALMNHALGLDLWRVLIIITLITAALAYLINFSRRPVQIAVPLVRAYAGTASFTLEIALIFAFQGLYGYTYSHLAVIFAAFMVGLTLGAALAPQLGIAHVELRLLMLFQTLLAVLASAVAPILTRLAAADPLATQAGSVALIPLLNLCVGALVGVQYPISVAACSPPAAPAPHPARLAASLYAMDLLGASLGALLAGALLIPILGIPNTCIAVSALSVASLPLLLVAESRKRPKRRPPPT